MGKTKKKSEMWLVFVVVDCVVGWSVVCCWVWWSSIEWNREVFVEDDCCAVLVGRRVVVLSVDADWFCFVCSVALVPGSQKSSDDMEKKKKRSTDHGLQIDAMIFVLHLLKKSSPSIDHLLTLIEWATKGVREFVELLFECCRVQCFLVQQSLQLNGSKWMLLLFMDQFLSIGRERERERERRIGWGEWWKIEHWCDADLLESIWSRSMLHHRVCSSDRWWSADDLCRWMFDGGCWRCVVAVDRSPSNHHW